jgi:hypothetical protein
MVVLWADGARPDDTVGGICSPANIGTLKIALGIGAKVLTVGRGSHGNSRRVLWKTAAGLLLVATLSAETWNYRGEVYGSIGAGRFYHGDHHWGSGLKLGGGVGVRLLGGGAAQAWAGSADAPLHFARTPSEPHSSAGNAASWQGASYGISPMPRRNCTF